MGAQITAGAVDERAMARAIDNNRHHTAGIILALAWQEGLTREELGGLTWAQVDFSGGQITLPDRSIPLTEECRALLLEWRELYGAACDRVVISEKLKKPMAPESISRLVRRALDEAGLPNVRIIDLRSDYIRRQLEQNDWARALQVSGLSVTTYRNTLAGSGRPVPPDTPEPRSRAEAQRRIPEIIRARADTPEGIALALSFYLGLRSVEIVALTWDRLDLAVGTLTTAGECIPLDAETEVLLRRELARRAPGEDPHIILSPVTRKPVTGSRLSTMVRTVLLRGGLEDASLSMTRRNRPVEAEKQKILDYVAAHGSISRSQCLALLDSTPNKVYARLNDLVFSESLVRVNSRYYLPDAVVPPEQHRDAIVHYLAENGTAYCQDIAELLHIGKRSTARILKKLVSGGVIVLLSQPRRYVLPGE